LVITRNHVNDDQDDGGISLSEWESVIQADTSLEAVPFIMGRNPRTGASVKVPLTGGVKWTGHPVGVSLPFSWSHGQILCYSVDGLTVAKVRELAARLGATCKESID
jgi:hypothetical protein